MEILDQISQALQKGKAKDVKEMVQAALDQGIAAQTILVDGLLSGMGVVGVKFKNNEVYVPDVLIAARAMKAGTEILRPQLAADGVKATGKIILGTVKGDLHDIGKNLVGMMMEGKGLEVVDLGVDVPAEKFIDAAIEHNANVVCCSALLTTTMGEMKNVVEVAKAKGVREKLTIMVGGAPVNDA
ncbi:MAG: cobalamin-dependent protein, partial [Eubacteriales bacterium]|nr:cobalamin-dependent protein [Eubacteriales bacterium]